jgi:hypothetical protein
VLGGMEKLVWDVSSYPLMYLIHSFLRSLMLRLNGKGRGKVEELLHQPPPLAQLHKNTPSPLFHLIPQFTK